MSRNLSVSVLEDRAKFYAYQWLSPDVTDPSTGKPRFGPKLVLRDMQNLAYKDEFNVVYANMNDLMGKKAWADFEKEFKKIATPREDKVLAQELKRRLAIDPDGNHIDGMIGVTKVGGRRIGTKIVEVEPIWSIQRRQALGLPKKGNRQTIHKIVNDDWPIYAGEEQERASGNAKLDRIPGPIEAALTAFMEDESGALNTRVSSEAVIAGLDALVIRLDEGTLGSLIVGYATAQATDPDTAVGGQTKLFSCVTTGTVTFIAPSTDAGGNALATANAITDDTSADATATLDWIRASSSSSSLVALDDHIDGEADTTGSDWTFNTVAIVTAATVSITSWTCSLSET